MAAAGGDNHTRLADLAPPFVVRHVYSTERVRDICFEKLKFAFSSLI